MEYRIMGREEIERMCEIDRSELIKEMYYLTDGELHVKGVLYNVKGFVPAELTHYIERLQRLYDRGGVVIGAFDGEKLVGITAVDNRFRGKNQDTVQMDVLYVSNSYRKKHIGKQLVELAKEKALAMGATRIYVSATPTRNTIDFYLGVGCVLATEVDMELFALEPEDIHLELII